MHHLETGRWYVVYSKPRKEETAQYHLQLKGLQVFLPRLLLPESNRKRQRVVPLFPNYLFVRIQDPEEFPYAQWAPGVRRFVSFNGVPAALEEHVLDYLMDQANPEGVITARSNLKAKQKVHITGGPFDGLVGVIQAPPDARGRVKVLLNLLNRQVRTEVPVQFISSGWVV
jgi:transcription elongation factor/antiterminator RfaH